MRGNENVEIDYEKVRKIVREEIQYALKQILKAMAES